MKLISFCLLSRYVCLPVAIATVLGAAVTDGQMATPAARSPAIADSSRPSDPSGLENPAPRLKWAEQLFSDGFYESARGQFQVVLNTHPDDQVARAGLDKAEQALAAVQGHTPEESAHMDKLRKKLEEMIVPQVFFDYTRLRDAIDFLRQESIRLDKDAGSDQQGIKFFMRFPNPAVTPDTPVSLRASNLSLLDALRQVLGQADMIAKVCADGMYLTGRDEVWPEKLITREFRVDPRTFTPAPDTGNVSSKAVETALKACGVQFPTGASATYLPATRKVVIRDTAENIEVAELMITGIE